MKCIWLQRKNIVSSKEKTKENDYLAADGLWYPSSKLEGYLKQTLKYEYWDTMSGVFTNMYPGILKELYTYENPLVKRIDKKSDYWAPQPAPIRVKRE